ncbi:universal stress protein [Pseudonocardia sp. TRM90224]|uniref:universal stress protein n=1 Tax=Pseudonocardia sp. TRM90224 TaxID=2812678 RepID=UPI001E647BB5|nr:universal stress protein [Pseudonocardia sp. TRM90224]
MSARTVVAWIIEGTWEATVDAAACAATPDRGETEVLLLAVVDAAVSEAVHGAFGGLFGRRGHDPGDAVAAQGVEGTHELLVQAEQRLDLPARREVRVGRVEREVVAACEHADLLVCSRDGDRSRLGPHSLGRHLRFVVDHAPCPVLLVWPDTSPDLDSIPPPPRHR